MTLSWANQRSNQRIGSSFYEVLHDKDTGIISYFISLYVRMEMDEIGNSLLVSMCASLGTELSCVANILNCIHNSLRHQPN